jgi:hypothetical protein
MRDPIRSLAISLLLALAPLALGGQGPTSAPAVRGGTYASLGVGFGGAGYRDYYGSQSTTWGESYSGALGFFVSPHWRLGVEGAYYVNQGLSTSSNCCNGHSYSGTGTAAFYPSISTSLWLKAGVGYGQMSGTLNQVSPGGGSSTVAYDQRGFAGGLGIGYDLRLGAGSMILAPSFSFQSFWQGGGRMPFRATDGQGTFFTLGLALGYSR